MASASPKGVGQALPANMETLKNTNGTTAKYATWCVRVLDPKVTPYTFTARNETVHAKKFECVLVSKDPKQYMFGSAPFSFQDRGAADKAFQRFPPKSVWLIQTPIFDTKKKPEYNGCPLKTVVQMMAPTHFTLVPPTNAEMLAYPAHHVEVDLDLTGIVHLLADLPFLERSGDGKIPSKYLDLGGKLVSLTALLLLFFAPLLKPFHIGPNGRGKL